MTGRVTGFISLFRVHIPDLRQVFDVDETPLLVPVEDIFEDLWILLGDLVSWNLKLPMAP